MTIGSIGNSGIGALASVPLNNQQRRTEETSSGTWFEALAAAWGNTLDNQADRIITMSDSIGIEGNDKPSEISKLTAESLRMGFLANSSSSSIDSVGKALETMARKG